MPLALEQNTKILHYLQKKNLDRLILNDFNDKETITNLTKDLDIILLENGAIYNNYFEIKNSKDIIFKFKKILFNKFDELKIILQTTEDIDDLECFLSISSNAQIRNLPCELANDNNIDDFHELLFSINHDEKFGSVLSNIQTILLVFKENISFKIHDISINNYESDTTLEMLETAYIEAKNYISKWITNEELKSSSVEDAIIKLSAINLWLISVQEDTGYLSGDMGKKNYYDQLMIQVENTIRTFNPKFNKDPENENSDNKPTINENLIGSV